MKSITQKIVFSLVFLVIIASCAKKNEPEGTYEDLDLNNLESKAVADSATAPISMAASQEVEGKKFVRKADVNMEVSDVYQATIYIENIAAKFWRKKYFLSLMKNPCLSVNISLKTKCKCGCRRKSYQIS